MWYLEVLVFVVCILSVASVSLPWSILVRESTIEPGCVLKPGFQFRLWGTACGITWDDFKNIEQHSYFAYAAIVGDIRAMVLSVTLLSIVQYVFTTFKGTIGSAMAVISLIFSVTSLIALSTYINDMNNNMAIPVTSIYIQGPGYMTIMSAIAVSGSIFFIQVFIYIFNYNYNARPSGICECMETCGFIVSLCSIIILSGKMFKTPECSDYMSLSGTCGFKSYNTTFAVINILACLPVYIIIKFFSDRIWLVNGFTGVSILTNFILIISTFASTSNIEEVGEASVFMFLGPLFGILLLLVYNKVIDVEPMKKICSKR